MVRKNVLPIYHAIVAGDMSGVLTSPVTNIQFLDNIMLQFNSTGAPAGEYTVECSADYQQDSQGNIVNAGNWTALLLNPLAVIAGAGTVVVDFNQVPGPYLRAIWTPSGGTGVLNMFISAKEI